MKVKFRNINEGIYKFELMEQLVVILERGAFPPDVSISEEYFTIQNDIINARIGYRWDGCTKAPDYEFTMRASLFHDILYQCFRMGLIRPTRRNRKRADKLFYEILISDGAPKILAKTYYYAVRMFGWITANSLEKLIKKMD